MSHKPFCGTENTVEWWLAKVGRFPFDSSVSRRATYLRTLVVGGNFFAPILQYFCNLSSLGSSCITHNDPIPLVLLAGPSIYYVSTCIERREGKGRWVRKWHFLPTFSYIYSLGLIFMLTQGEGLSSIYSWSIGHILKHEFF